MWAQLTIFSLVIFLAGCASTDDDYNPNIHPAAYEVEHFRFQWPAPDRSEIDTTPFYFKDCNVAQLGDHVTRTSFYCEYP